MHRLSVVLAASQCRKYAESDVDLRSLPRYIDSFHAQTNYCVCERSELRKGLLAITLHGWSVVVSKGVGSKIGVARLGAYEVIAVLCAKGVQVDGYLSVAHFTACTTVHNSGGRHLRMGGGGGGGRTVCMRA